MKREQLIAKLRRYARKNGLDFTLNTKAGKGSHYKLWIGGKATLIKSGELSPGYVRVILGQLGIKQDAI